MPSRTASNPQFPQPNLIPSNCLSLITQIAADYPNIHFIHSKRFSCRLKAQPSSIIINTGVNTNTDTSASTNTNINTATSTAKASNLANSPIATIYLGPPQPNFAFLTLHELGHAILGHRDWSTDVSRLKCEREAWECARKVFLTYQKKSPDLAKHLVWDDDFVESQLDTYRDWLHLKSRCTKCGLTRYQDQSGAYHCPRCDTFTL